MLLLKCSESLHEPDGQVHVPMIQTVTKQVEVPQIQYEDEVVEVPIQKQARGLGAWLVDTSLCPPRDNLLAHP